MANALTLNVRGKMRSRWPIADLAERQQGVVARHQLVSQGYSEAAIDRMIQTGSLHGVHRGVYAVGHRVLYAHGRCLAAVLACGPSASLSHSSAAWLWGFFPTCSRPIHVTVPTRGHGVSGIELHHAPALTDEDRTNQEGITVTSVPRTLLDLAAAVPRRRLERAIERSEQLGVFDLRAVDSLLARVRGHHGCGRLKRVLADYRDPVFTRSELERRFLGLVREAGLPEPSVNTFVAGHELDMYWPERRFAVELDGYEYHRTRAAFERDHIREEELKLASIEMIRFTAFRIDREPKTVVRRLRYLLSQRQQGH